MSFADKVLDDAVSKTLADIEQAEESRCTKRKENINKDFTSKVACYKGEFKPALENYQRESKSATSYQVKKFLFDLSNKISKANAQPSVHSQKAYTEASALVVEDSKIPFTEFPNKLQQIAKELKQNGNSKGLLPLLDSYLIRANELVEEKSKQEQQIEKEKRLAIKKAEMGISSFIEEKLNQKFKDLCAAKDTKEEKEYGRLLATEAHMKETYEQAKKDKKAAKPKSPEFYYEETRKPANERTCDTDNATEAMQAANAAYTAAKEELKHAKEALQAHKKIIEKFLIEKIALLMDKKDYDNFIQRICAELKQQYSPSQNKAPSLPLVSGSPIGMGQGPSHQGLSSKSSNDEKIINAATAVANTNVSSVNCQARL